MRLGRAPIYYFCDSHRSYQFTACSTLAGYGFTDVATTMARNVQSLGEARLKTALETVDSLQLEADDGAGDARIDYARLAGTVFVIGRLASELSLCVACHGGGAI